MRELVLLMTAFARTIGIDYSGAQTAEDAPTLVGIDHGFSFPLRYSSRTA